MTVDQVLAVLNRHKVRATYGAVAQVLGISARNVGNRLGKRRPEASWVVNAKTGKPSGYLPHECHKDLYSNSTILRTGAQVQALFAESSKGQRRFVANDTELRLIGIDLAWQSDNNGSGIAIGKLSDNRLNVEQIHCGVIGLDSVIQTIRSVDGLRGLAIDAPLIIKNRTGSRPCERELSSVYGSRWASCHPSNLGLYPNALSVQLSKTLEAEGFQHLGDAATAKWQLECYPHPAIIELFELEKRLAYKRGRVNERQSGQAQLARHIKSLESRSTLSLQIDQRYREIFDESRIMKLRGQAGKDNEDGLDSVICLYIAGLYAIGAKMQSFGDRESGYIVVPNQNCT